MTLTEIDREFDILYNNIASGAAPALNSYEKSVLLTKAQEEIVINYYNGANARYSSFESSEEIRRYLDTLIVTVTLLPSSTSTLFGKKIIKFSKPGDLLFVLRETAKTSGEGCADGREIAVVPVTHETLNRVVANPFKGPSDMKAIRFDNSDSNGVEFILMGKDDIGSYDITYLKRPSPIILEDLSIYGNDFTVNNEVGPSNSDAPDLLMRKTINRAVELAKVAYIGDLGATLSINGRSQ